MPYLTLVITQLTKFPPENVSTTSSSHLSEIYSDIFLLQKNRLLSEGSLQTAIISAPAAKK